MIFFRIINIIITILNALYVILINTFYVQLPVPNKEYLRDLKFRWSIPLFIYKYFHYRFTNKYIITIYL